MDSEASLELALSLPCPDLRFCRTSPYSTVDGLDRDPEVSPNLMPRVFPAIPHRFDDTYLLRRKQLLTATHPASRPRRRKTRQSALPNQLPFKLRQGSEEVKYESACGCTGVELLFERDEVDAALVEPINELEEVADRTAQPVKPPYHKGVSLFQPIQAFLQLRSIQRAAAHCLLINTLAASLLQVRELPRCVLLFG
jgi:hypothetical protein